MKNLELRDYQKECVETLNHLDGGSHLVSVATGLGKTVIFSQLERKGRVLILSHRDELVHQPQKYYDCSFGVEQAEEKSHGEEVVSASVQSIVRRLDKFSPDDFDMIITDEAHHAAAKSYRKIYDYFKPRLHIGFTATPNRGDKVRLDDVFEDIIFQRDLRWGIKNGYLTDINCLQADIGYDLTKVHKKMGDFEVKELAQAINQEKMNKGIAEAYRQLAVGQTIIFAANVAHATAIANEIEGAVVVSAQTKNRAEIIEKFTNREIPCIVNCMVFTEGTDIPLIETIIIARPTTNESLYTQMVGRGLRLYEGKKFLTLIDCVGVTEKNEICTAPSLLGIDISEIPPKNRNQVTGMLSQMEHKVQKLLDTPEAWIINTREINLFAEENSLDLHHVNCKKRYDGSLICGLQGQTQIRLTSVDEIGRTDVLYCKGQEYAPVVLAENIPIQDALDRTFVYLQNNFPKLRQLWDMEKVSVWGRNPASQAQKNLIRKLLNKRENIRKYHCPNYDVSNLTKYEASIIIDRLLS